MLRREQSSLTDLTHVIDAPGAISIVPGWEGETGQSCAIRAKALAAIKLCTFQAVPLVHIF